MRPVVTLFPFHLCPCFARAAHAMYQHAGRKLSVALREHQQRDDVCLHGPVAVPLEIEVRQRLWDRGELLLLPSPFVPRLLALDQVREASALDHASQQRVALVPAPSKRKRFVSIGERLQIVWCSGLLGIEVVGPMPACVYWSTKVTDTCNTKHPPWIGLMHKYQCLLVRDRLANFKL